MSILRAAAVAELVSLAVRLTNLATVHVPWIASLIGPIHGCAYLLVIGAAYRLTRSAGTTVLAAIPIVGGLIALRRVKQPD